MSSIISTYLCTFNTYDNQLVHNLDDWFNYEYQFILALKDTLIHYLITDMIKCLLLHRYIRMDIT